VPFDRDRAEVTWRQRSLCQPVVQPRPETHMAHVGAGRIGLPAVQFTSDEKTGRMDQVALGVDRQRTSWTARRFDDGCIGGSTEADL
jgi:hypothetical protein